MKASEEILKVSSESMSGRHLKRDRNWKDGFEEISMIFCHMARAIPGPDLARICLESSNMTTIMCLQALHKSDMVRPPYAHVTQTKESASDDISRTWGYTHLL